MKSRAAFNLGSVEFMGVTVNDIKVETNVDVTTSEIKDYLGTIVNLIQDLPEIMDSIGRGLYYEK